MVDSQRLGYSQTTVSTGSCPDTRLPAGVTLAPNGCSAHLAFGQRSRESPRSAKLARSFFHSRAQHPARASLRQGHMRRTCPYFNSKKWPPSPKVSSAYLNSQVEDADDRGMAHPSANVLKPHRGGSGDFLLPLTWFYLVPRTECGQECQIRPTHGSPEAVHIQSPPSHPVLCRCGWQGCRPPERHKTSLRISFPEG